MESAARKRSTGAGVAFSCVGGLTPWNVDYVTTRLVIDPGMPGHLFRLTEAGEWQYPLNAAQRR